MPPGFHFHQTSALDSVPCPAASTSLLGRLGHIHLNLSRTDSTSPSHPPPAPSTFWLRATLCFLGLSEQLGIILNMRYYTICKYLNVYDEKNLMFASNERRNISFLSRHGGQMLEDTPFRICLPRPLSVLLPCWSPHPTAAMQASFPLLGPGLLLPEGLLGPIPLPRTVWPLRGGWQTSSLPWVLLSGASRTPSQRVPSNGQGETGPDLSPG